MRVFRDAFKYRSTTNQSFRSLRRRSSPSSQKPSVYGRISDTKVAVTMVAAPRDSASSLTSAPTSPGVSRPMAHIPYNIRTPTLKEILADQSPEPWTLEAFTEYCEQNMCSENLNFVMSAKEYKRDYNEWAANCSTPRSPADKQHAAQLIVSWTDLLAEYTNSGAPQEINVPGSVRHELNAKTAIDSPVHPEMLKPALHKIYELMQDSVLMSFINDVRPVSLSEEDLGPPDEKIKSKSIQIVTPLSGSPTSAAGILSPGSQPRHKQSIGSNSSYVSGRRKSVASAREIGEAGEDRASGISSRPTPQSAMSHDGVRSPPPPRQRFESGWKKIGEKLKLKKSKSGPAVSRDSRDSDAASSD